MDTHRPLGRSRIGRTAIALTSALALQACIAAAALPVAAGASIGRKVARGKAQGSPRLPAAEGITVLPPGSELPPPDGARPTPRPLPAAPSGSAGSLSAGAQYLYGSGEGAALSIQAWRALVRHVADKSLQRPKDSVILATGATLARPAWEPCGTKPAAVVLDIDETAVLNLGLQHHLSGGAALTDAQRQQWERDGGAQVVAVPGAARAVEALRTMGVAVVFNTDRSQANAAPTVAMLAAVGLGPVVAGETLFLAEEGPGGERKDPRRAAIASRYCVLAMAGDQLGDFSDLFDAEQGPAARRSETLSTPVNARFGAGWFLLPNPVYGSALRGTIDDVFPQDMRWRPAQ